MLLQVYRVDFGVKYNQRLKRCADDFFLETTSPIYVKMVGFLHSIVASPDNLPVIDCCGSAKILLIVVS